MTARRGRGAVFSGNHPLFLFANPAELRSGTLDSVGEADLFPLIQNNGGPLPRLSPRCPARQPGRGGGGSVLTLIPRDSRRPLAALPFQWRYSFPFPSPLVLRACER